MARLFLFFLAISAWMARADRVANPNAAKAFQSIMEQMAQPTGTNLSFPSSQDAKVMAACDRAYIARLSLASMYGSCEAPMAAKGGSIPADSMCQSSTTGNPGTLADVWRNHRDCPTTSPKKPSYSQDGARMRVNGSLVEPAPGGTTDCSGFFSGVCAAAGMRLQPGKDLTQPTTTAELVKTLGGSGSCFKEVTGALLPNDVIVYNNGVKGHVYMINTISSGGGGACDFSIIESSGGDDAQYGGPRVVTKGNSSGGGVVSDEAGMAISGLSKSCIAQKKAQMKIVRFDPDHPGCQGPRKHFANEQCLKKCSTLGSNDLGS